MILVTIGNHNQGFDRLIKRIDEVAPKLKEKIIIQRGYTKYVPKNCESFDFSPSLDDYYKKARLIIVHSAMSLIEIIKKYKKPLITVPRQYKFKEHINDHQVEFAESVEKRLGIKAIYDIHDLTPKLLKSYSKVVKIDTSNLIKLQEYMKKLIANNEKWRVKS
jgi:beta-1,4-N-acetylglucosaminyltransferase